MKAAKKDAAIHCEALSRATLAFRKLMEEFEGSSPEEVRKGIEVFASAVKQSGLVQEEEKDKSSKVLLSDLIDVLPTKEFGQHMADVETFELLISEYNDPDEEDMNQARELLESFGPKLVAELERIGIEKGCPQTRAIS